MEEGFQFLNDPHTNHSSTILPPLTGFSPALRDAEVMQKERFDAARRTFLAGLFACFAFFAFDERILAQAPQPPTTILLFRHAEKPPAEAASMDLSPAGVERASRLPQLFTGAHSLPHPDYLFATHASKKSNREVETITPLSKALGLPISAEVDDKEFAVLATELLSGKYAGKVVLVDWHHGTLPQFAKALGATPPYDRWPDTQFDRFWRIDYRNGHASLTERPELLLPGDSK